MNEAQPHCPACGGSLFDEDTKYYCSHCEKEFCPYCWHSIKNDADGNPCAHYVITDSSDGYFDLLDHMPEVFADNAPESAFLSDALSDLDELCVPFIYACFETENSYYNFCYSEMGGKAVWELIGPLLEKEEA